MNLNELITKMTAGEVAGWGLIALVPSQTESLGLHLWLDWPEGQRKDAGTAEHTSRAST